MNWFAKIAITFLIHFVGWLALMILSSMIGWDWHFPQLLTTYIIGGVAFVVGDGFLGATDDR